MFSLSSTVIGVMAAAAASFGALHFEAASGGDAHSRVASLKQNGPVETMSSAVQQHINRAAKSDRLDVANRSAPAERTIALSIVGMGDTSVLVRVPVAQPQGRRGPIQKKPVLTPARGNATRKLVACEPIASLLTEAGRTMAAGRCVT
jgi:hypothetical protein